MKRKFDYSIPEMNRRLLAIGRPIRKYLVISTLSSIIGALSHMGLMGFGALCLLAAAGFCSGVSRYAALTVLCAVLIAVAAIWRVSFPILVRTAFLPKCGCTCMKRSTAYHRRI